MSHDTDRSATEKQVLEIIEGQQKLMLDEVLSVIDGATKAVALKLKELNPEQRLPPFDYFASVVRHALLMKMCDADSNGMNGNVKLAKSIIGSDYKYVSHHWDGKLTGPTFETETQLDQHDRFDVDNGARGAALRTVLQALVRQADVADAQFSKKVVADIDSYLLRLAPQSELELDFAERARRYTLSFIGKPSV